MNELIVYSVEGGTGARPVSTRLMNGWIFYFNADGTLALPGGL